MNNQRSQRRSSMMVRLVAVLAVTMMFTMCFVGGTFAKYTSSATGTDSAQVAKWDIKVGSTNIVTSDVFYFDLFSTVKDSNGTDNETDMSPADGTIIAPGTSGKFDIVITNDSQVNATYNIDYTVTNTNGIPVQFSTDGSTWKTNINDLDVSTNAPINMRAQETVTVYWKWDYSVDVDHDTADTNLGKEGTATITVSAKVTATQVD